MSVFVSGGSALAFFEPFSQGVSRYAKGSRYPAHTRTLLISSDDFCLTRLAIAEVRIFPTRLTARSALIFLFAIRRFTVFDQLFASTVVALDVDHALAYQFDLNHYLLMDNWRAKHPEGSVHHGEDVRELVEDYGCKLLYLPTYSPDLNPIKHLFAKLKAFIKSLRLIFTRFHGVAVKQLWRSVPSRNC